MKKLLIILGIVSVLSACDEKYYPVIITNESEKNVSYIYNGISDTLSAGGFTAYEVKAYTQPPKNYIDENGIASISLKTNGMTGNYTFLDITEIELNVMNTLLLDVIIKADNYIDNNGSTELNIKSGETETAVIYTEKPEFESDANFPIDFKFEIISLEELDKFNKPKKKMFLTIR
jgi:hypothetical protein